jgi:hypothetical protein
MPTQVRCEDHIKEITYESKMGYRYSLRGAVLT